MNFGRLTQTLAFIFLAVAATAQVRAQSEKAAPEAPEKISRSAARAQAERQRAAAAGAQRQRAAARAQAESQRAAAAEAQRQRAAARAQAENARLAQQQVYANQQALISNTVAPTAPAKNSETRTSRLLDSVPVGLDLTFCFYENQRRFTVPSGQSCPLKLADIEAEKQPTASTTNVSTTTAPFSAADFLKNLPSPRKLFQGL